jgi:hypothetical protein
VTTSLGVTFKSTGPGGKALHPAEHGDVIDLHAALEQQLLDVPIQQVEA